MIPALATIALFMLSAYIIFVVTIVTGRMDRNTPHKKRIAIVLSGGIAVWSMAKCVTVSWTYSWGDIVLAAAVAVIAAALLSQPRIQV